MTPTTLQRLKQLAVTRFGPPAAMLGPDDDLFEVLSIDSMAALDLLTDLENAFDIEIPDYEIQGVHTLGGLAEVIEDRI